MKELVGRIIYFCGNFSRQYLKVTPSKEPPRVFYYETNKNIQDKSTLLTSIYISFYTGLPIYCVSN